MVLRARSSNVKKFLIIVLVSLIAFAAIALIVGLFADTLNMTPTEGEVRVRAGAATCWSGQIGDATRDGCGAMTYPVSSDLGSIVAVVQKKSDDAEGLTVEVWIDGKLADTATTTAAYGLVTVSATD